ncbi:Dephospho-CoA kinase [Candidatus Providencia siddallii]|uniref:Dephospho-CoA kinase n=1 Tax=Candidatus Providencia siddallii TaxID=1715285 RepID=A0A0M6W930_9GAMM|nr:Dephospho-CoA kinase [Candidatus Providencia siddallii]
MSYVVALTGGIGSGKTTISNEFIKLGVPIIDADIISRKVVEPNTIAFKSIVNHFSNQVVRQDGYLDRTKLREIVFSNVKEKKWINKLIHCLIQKETEKQIKLINYPYVLWVTPLLIENDIYHLANRVLVVDVTKKEQISRTIKRDNINIKQVNNILKAQINRKKRLDYADDVIINHDNNMNLFNDIINLHNQYLKLSSLIY